MTTYTLETKDPTFSGVTQEASVIESWSRGMLKKVHLSPMGIIAILVHPWLAKDQKSFECGHTKRDTKLKLSLLVY